MTRQLRYTPVALTIGTFLAASFALCVAWDAVFPDWAMRRAWEPLLPGFSWLSIGTFLLGLAEAFLYGFWLALVVPVARWTSQRLDTDHQSARSTA